MENVEKLR